MEFAVTVARVGDMLGLGRRQKDVTVDPLIKEARDRQWHRRRRIVLALLVVTIIGAAAYREWQPGGGGGGAPVISSQGIGGVFLGEPENQAVMQLTRLFGPPSGRFINTGCGPRFKEVAWKHLYVEFRSERLTGFRYILDGWPPHRSGTHPAPGARPQLTTAKGLTLGATLGKLQQTYGRLRFVGTDRWQASDGLIFYDNAQRDPEPTSSQIVEIKYGTCGDF